MDSSAECPRMTAVVEIKMTNYKHILFASVASVVLFASGALSVLAPLPFMVIAGRQSQRSALIAALAAIIIVFIFGFLLKLVGTIHFLGLAVLGMFWGHALIKRMPLVKIGVFTLFATFLVSALFLLLFHSQITSVVTGIMNSFFELDGRGDLVGMKDDLISFSVKYMPALIAISALMGVFVNFGLIGRFVPGKQTQSLNSVCLPEKFVWAVIAAGFLFFADIYFFNNPILRWIVSSSLIMLGGLYFFQGLAVAMFYLSRWQSKFLRYFFWISLILFVQFIGTFLIGLGLSDVWFGFRKKQEVL